MSELIVVEQINPVELFNGKNIDPLLERITAQVKEFVPDTSTAKGRKEIAALAHKVAKSKTFLDAAGKELVSGWKNQAKVVDAERKKMRDYLDNLKDETRKPLTDWEAEEEERQKIIDDKIQAIKTAVTVENEDYSKRSASEMEVEFESLKNTIIDESFGDRANEAAIEKEKAVQYFAQVIDAREKYEAEQAELERLRQEAEARKKADEEERLRKEGEERARLAAEAKAKAEKERIEREAKEKAEAEKRERERIEAEKQAAIDAQIEAERKAKEAEERAVAQSLAAEREAERVRQETIKNEAIAKERAKVEAENAAKVERDRIERERQAEIEAEKRREADKAHKAKINNAAMDALVSVGLADPDAKKAIIAIASGKVPHVKISY